MDVPPYAWLPGLNLEPPSLMVNGSVRPVNSRLSRIGSIFFPSRAQVWRAYAAAMLGRLQDRRGEPRLRSRVLAALVIVGLLLLTAPLALIPVVRWLFGFL